MKNKNCITFKPTPIQPLMIEKVSDQMGDETIFFHSDVKLYLNEQRLRSLLGDASVNSLINAMPVTSKSPYKEGVFSDSQLLTLVKSRYCQSKSEIRSYQNMILELAKENSDVVADIKRQIEEEQQQQQQQEQQSNSTE